MRLQHRACIWLIALAVFVALPAVAADFEWNGKLAAGQTIEVRGLNGSIEAVGSESDSVEVTAVKSGTDADEVKIEVTEHSGGVKIVAVYPKEHRKNFRAKVEFAVKVPEGVKFAAHTVNGDVRADALSSEVEAQTVNGSVRISTSREAHAKTVNGSIAARVGEDRFDQPVKLETVNGSITVDVPGGLNADFQATTVNGKLQLDVPVTISGTVSKRKMNGRMGEGGPLLALQTVNGKITVQPTK